jgi:hypothetical protein
MQAQMEHVSGWKSSRVAALNKSTQPALCFTNIFLQRSQSDTFSDEYILLVVVVDEWGIE